MKVELPRCQGCGKPSTKIGGICAACLSATLLYLCQKGVPGPVMPWLRERLGAEFDDGLRRLAYHLAHKEKESHGSP